MDIISQRRSVNWFDPERSMTQDDVYKILDLAANAPSAMNLQPWEVICVASAEKKKLLRECAFDQPKIEEASVVLIILGNTLAIEQNGEKIFEAAVKLGYYDSEKAKSMLDGAKKFYGEPDSERRKSFASENASLFAMSVMYSAKFFGYESHPMGGFSEEKIRKNFNIDKSKTIPMLIALGYKKEDKELLPRSIRISSREFCSFE